MQYTLHQIPRRRYTYRWNADCTFVITRSWGVNKKKKEESDSWPFLIKPQLTPVIMLYHFCSRGKTKKKIPSSISRVMFYYDNGIIKFIKIKEYTIISGKLFIMIFGENWSLFASICTNATVVFSSLLVGNHRHNKLVRN